MGIHPKQKRWFLADSQNLSDRMFFHYNPIKFTVNQDNEYDHKNKAGLILSPTWTASVPKKFTLSVVFDDWSVPQDRKAGLRNTEDSIDWLNLKMYPKLVVKKTTEEGSFEVNTLDGRSEFVNFIQNSSEGGVDQFPPRLVFVWREVSPCFLASVSVTRSKCLPYSQADKNSGSLTGHAASTLDQLLLENDAAFPPLEKGVDSIQFLQFQATKANSAIRAEVEITLIEALAPLQSIQEQLAEAKQTETNAKSTEKG